jgi:hypothetical protein
MDIANTKISFICYYPMKKILDVCCGGRTFRRDKNNPLAEYMDIRREEA